MIERDPATGLYRCFKCSREAPAQQFLYTHLAESEEDLKKCVDNGTVWACEYCFMRSRFCKTVLEPPSSDTRDGGSSSNGSAAGLTVCMHCQVAKPAMQFACFGRWFEGSDDVWDMSAERLHNFMRGKFLMWGCNDCFANCPLRAYKSSLSGKWRSRCPPTSRVGMYRVRNEKVQGKFPRKKRRFLFTMKKTVPASWKKS